MSLGCSGDNLEMALFKVQVLFGGGVSGSGLVDRRGGRA